MKKAKEFNEQLMKEADERHFNSLKKWYIRLRQKEIEFAKETEKIKIRISNLELMTDSQILEEYISSVDTEYYSGGLK